MTKNKTINVRVSKKLNEDVANTAKKRGLNITQFVTTALIHEINGRTDYNHAIQELSSLSEYVDERVKKLNAIHSVTQNEAVTQDVTQNKPGKLEDVSQRPLREINTLELAIRYVKDKVFNSPFLPYPMVENLSLQVGLTTEEFLKELDKAGIEFTLD